MIDALEMLVVLPDSLKVELAVHPIEVTEIEVAGLGVVAPISFVVCPGCSVDVV